MKTGVKVACAILCGASLMPVGIASAQGYRDGGYGRPAVEAVEGHLERIASEAYWSHGEHNRAGHALRHLARFDQRWHEGRFDKGELDAAIGDVQDVIDHNRMNDRQRDLLWHDVGSLRSFRASRGYREGYR